MQILILVFSLLLALAFLTNGLWQSHVSSHLIRTTYTSYLMKREQARINHIHANLYRRLKEGGGSSKGIPKANTQKNLLTAKLNLRRALEEGEQTSPYRDLMKNLLHTTYGRYEFYQRAQKQFPHLEETLLQAIAKAINGEPLKGNLAKLTSLAQLDLNQEVLQEVFYRMLKGTRDPLISDTDQGYPPLLTMVEGKEPAREQGISIYQAHEPLLLTLFTDPRVVEEIVRLRNSLYQASQQEGADLNALEQEFQRHFGHLHTTGGAAINLNFTLNKEPPPSW